MDELLDAIRSALTADLLTPEWRARAAEPQARPYTGHCYVAAEAAYHLLGGRAVGLHPMSVSREHGGPHWFLVDDAGNIIDPTSEQFAQRELERLYAHARGRGFLTKQPSRRARIVMDRVRRGIENPEARTVMRPAGWEATGDEGLEALREWKRTGHVYRGMTAQEYDATVGRGKPVQSTGRHSFKSEGTNFADDPGDAESFANYGRDDPRKTGRPTYLVEVRRTPTMEQWPDGYIKAQAPIPHSQVARVWKMYADGGVLVAEQIKNVKNPDSSLPAGFEGFDGPETVYQPDARDRALAFLGSLRPGDKLDFPKASFLVRHAQGALVYVQKANTKGTKLYRLVTAALEPLTLEVCEVYGGSGDLMPGKPVAARGTFNT